MPSRDRNEYMKFYMQRRRAAQRAERLAAGDGDARAGDVALAQHESDNDTLGQWMLIGIGVLAIAAIACACGLRERQKEKAEAANTEN